MISSFQKIEFLIQKVLKINTIRALQKEVNLKPTESKWKIFIIEPAEKITLEAANCLLKTLEEPPNHTIMILLALHKDQSVKGTDPF